MSSTSLVTQGYICYQGQPIPVPTPASLDSPEVQKALEVRPKIRFAQSLTTPPTAKPVITSVQELRPQLSGRVVSEPPPSKPPMVRTIQELRPKITDAKEEE